MYVNFSNSNHFPSNKFYFLFNAYKVNCKTKEKKKYCESDINNQRIFGHD